MRRYRVRVTREARDDLERLLRFFAEDDPASVRLVAELIAESFRTLTVLPFASRMASAARPDPSMRELVVPFRSAGYVVLFRVTDRRTVSILAVRHQLEEDYH